MENPAATKDIPRTAQVRIIPKMTYQVETLNDKTQLGVFHKESEWHGMICLVADNGNMLILADHQDGLNRLFELFRMPEEERDVFAVSASPQLLEIFNEPVGGEM